MAASNSFDDLLDWFDGALERLSSVPMRRESRRHLRRMHRILLQSEHPERFPEDWKKLARKVAERLGEEPPQMPAFHRSKRLRRSLEETIPPARVRDGDRPPQFQPSWKPQRAPRRRATRPPRETLQMNAQLEAAFAAVEKRKPIVFVTGGAGTGKSTFIRELTDDHTHEPRSARRPPTQVPRYARNDTD